MYPSIQAHIHHTCTESCVAQRKARVFPQRERKTWFYECIKQAHEIKTSFHRWWKCDVLCTRKCNLKVWFKTQPRFDWSLEIVGSFLLSKTARNCFPEKDNFRFHWNKSLKFYMIASYENQIKRNSKFSKGDEEYHSKLAMPEIDFTPHQSSRN